MSEEQKSPLKRIMFINPITQKPETLKIKREIIENTTKFPVAITTFHGETPITIFIDAKFKVRGVEASIFLENKTEESKIVATSDELTPDEKKATQKLEEKKEDLIEKQEEGSMFGQILLLGLSKAGKSTIAHRISKNEFKSNQRPTLSTQVLRTVIDQLNFHIYDVGGQEKLRKFWFTTVKSPNAIMYVIDASSDSKTQRDAAEEFEKVVVEYFGDDKSTKNIPILILANKMDLMTVMGETNQEIIQRISGKLRAYRFSFNYRIGVVSALTGEGVDLNLKWLVSELINLQ